MTTVSSLILPKFAAMVKIEAWFKAFRLRTLPLSFSSVILGSMLAADMGSFSLKILIGALVTTLFLQVLSNLANDYGDSVSGVDNEKRTGPARSVQSGEISAAHMRLAIGLCALLALVAGILLLYESSKKIGLNSTVAFFLLGVAAIVAAIKYTIGKNPYGYRGFGDLAVFIFFGIVGVSGTYYLHTSEISGMTMLPAVSVGLLATAVLNINNMRDIENDSTSGKRSLVVLIGLRRAKIYHTILISLALMGALAFTLLRFRSVYEFLFLISVPLLYQNVRIVWTTNQVSELDGELKKLALATLIFSITLGLGLIY